jgi:hypothetical protein
MLLGLPLMPKMGKGVFSNSGGGGGSQPVELLLTSTGDGSGVAQLGMTASEDTVITLGDNAKFYSDAAGTLDESSTLVIGTTETTRYVKCTTGTATYTIADNKITRWDISDGDGWDAGTNAPSIGGSIETLTSLTFLYVYGSNTLSGSVAGLTSLTFLYVLGDNTLTGSVAGLTSLTTLYVLGDNTLTGDMSDNNMVNGITSMTLNPCAMTTYTGGATWSDVGADIQPAAAYGYDSTSIDNILIDMANSAGGPTNRTITLTGSSAARTAASDAAVSTLTGRGCTVVTN